MASFKSIVPQVRNRTTILVIEDDPDIIELVRYNLGKNGFFVEVVLNGAEALQYVKKNPPSLILLDLMLPQMDGLEICRLLKAQDETRRIPVIILTAKGEETDIILGLEMGADDYVVKPFSPRELVARIRAVLRRSLPVSDGKTLNLIQAGPLFIHSDRHEVVLRKKTLNLTLAEFRLLKLLASSPGRVYTRDQLLDVVTGGDAVVVDRNIDVHVHGIRKKLGVDGHLIETIRGIGYKFADL